MQNSAKSSDTTSSSGDADNPETKDLSQIVSFQKENFVQTRNLDENRYDTILW